MPPPSLPQPIRSPTLFDLASRFIGESERVGPADNPMIRWAHLLTGGEAADTLAWCSSQLNLWCHVRGVQRSHAKSARSWLAVGERLADPSDAQRGWDVCVLTRGEGPQPGVDVLDAPGHVGLFSRWLDGGSRVELLGGNQGDRVCLAPFNSDRILAVQRLWSPPEDPLSRTVVHQP
jgi:uncharacterized protein (TIGR02594 family)